MKIIIVLLIALLGACSSTNDLPANQQDAKQEMPESKKVYFFQHRLLPKWTYTSGGGFYADLINGDLSKLKNAATEIISEDYARNLKSESFKEHNAVLITFPEPKDFPNCFFVLIKKTDDGFEYYTYEKTVSLNANDPVNGVVGTWSRDGGHGNLGGRTYKTASDFVKDVLKVK